MHVILAVVRLAQAGNFVIADDHFSESWTTCEALQSFPKEDSVPHRPTARLAYLVLIIDLKNAQAFLKFVSLTYSQHLIRTWQQQASGVRRG